MATNTDECEEAIKFISSRIGHYTKPENLLKWCELAKTEIGYDKSAGNLSLLLKDAKYFVELNKWGIITFCRSPDGTVLESTHSRRQKYFEGKLDYDKRKTGDMQVRSPGSVRDPLDVNHQSKGDKAPKIKTNEKSNLKPEEDVDAITFNGQIEYDDMDNEDRPEFMVVNEKEPPNHHKKRHPEPSQENAKRRKINNPKESEVANPPEVDEEARELEQDSEESDDPSFRVPVRDQSIESTDSSQDLCEKSIRFISNRIKNYTHPEKLWKWCELAKTEVGYEFTAKTLSRVITEKLDKIEELQGYSLKEKVHLVFIFSRPVSKEFADELKEKNCTVELNDERRIAFFGSPDKTSFLKSKHSKKQKYFMGKPNYDNKKTAEEQARRSQSVQNPPDITSNNQKQENKAPQGRSSESVRNSTPPPSPQILQNSPEIDDVEAPEQNSLDSDDLGPIVNDSFNNQNQDAQPNFGENNQKRVKIEDFLEEIQQEPEVWIPEEKPEIPPPTLSLHKLAEQIETLAFNVNLEEGFQQKALRAARLFKANDQAFPIQDFNQLFNFFLTSLKRERTQNSNENSIKLIRLFKHLQRTLIRPLGEDLISEALGILDEEIQKREENEEKVFVPLKTVQSKIDGLMHFITSAWADLDQ
ncbi:hypothetical protein B9Z55_027815 [Caenorhabditis nigoni]|uniref:SPK domain-containing protein n=1 Tax=Caenorhabditis nigoni TaxID=1611254 RepID=A0A2G5SEK4_9PELO|nr:hypothetical protein B9Z55_027815 [Caenorhabditis nigoni]